MCHLCQQHLWCTLSCQYLSELSKKFEMALMVYSGAWGKLIHKKVENLVTLSLSGTPSFIAFVTRIPGTADSVPNTAVFLLINLPLPSRVY
jgi:hypothetical protein